MPFNVFYGKHLKYVLSMIVGYCHQGKDEPAGGEATNGLRETRYTIYGVFGVKRGQR